MDNDGRMIDPSRRQEKGGRNIARNFSGLLRLSSNDGTPEVDEDSFLEKAKLKSKATVVSAWHNVKYGTISSLVFMFCVI